MTPSAAGTAKPIGCQQDGGLTDTFQGKNKRNIDMQDHSFVTHEQG